MSQGPFRELFVELPEKVFEFLKALGETAIQRAQSQPAAKRTTTLFLQSVEQIKGFERWAKVEAYYDTLERTLHMDATCHCHGREFSITVSDNELVVTDDPVFLVMQKLEKRSIQIHRRPPN